MELGLITLALSAVTAFLGVWNAYNNALIGKIIAELQLNLRKEFNGRYLTLEASALIKEAGEIEHASLSDRIKRIEKD